MDYGLLLSTAWKLIWKSKLLWAVSLIFVSIYSVILLIPNIPIRYLSYLIVLNLFGIWLNFIEYSLALDKNVNLQETWGVTRSLLFKLSILYVFSFMMVIIILLIAYIFYGIDYMMTFNVSVKSIPPPNYFIFTMLFYFTAYLIINIPLTFCVLGVIRQQKSGILASYRQAIKILKKNIGHLLRLAFLFAFLIWTYIFILFII